MSNSENVSRKRVVAIAHELKIPVEDAENMIDDPEDCWF